MHFDCRNQALVQTVLGIYAKDDIQQELQSVTHMENLLPNLYNLAGTLGLDENADKWSPATL